MKPPVTTQPLHTVSLSELYGKPVEGLVVLLSPRTEDPDEEPRWRRAVKVTRKKAYQKWWITLFWQKEEDGECDFTGGVEGLTADRITVQVTAEDYAKIVSPSHSS